MILRFDEPLNNEIMEEAAASLGDAGRRLQRSLADLRRYDEAVASGARVLEPAARERLVAIAADALWDLVVQRELLGFRDESFVARHYDVPREVWRVMGPMSASPR